MASTTSAGCGSSDFGCVLTLTDIPEREQGPEGLAFLAAIVNGSNDAIVGKTLDGVVTSWNPAAEAIYGYLAEEMIGRSVATVIPPDRRQEFNDIMAQIKLSKRVEHLETVRVKKDGTRFNVSLSVSPIRDRMGTVWGAATIARDITERKRAEEARKRPEIELKEAQRLAQLGSWTLDLVTKEVTWTEELYRMTGRDSDLGTPSFPEQEKIFAPSSWAQLTAVVDEAAHKGKPYELELEMVRPDRSSGYMLARGEAVRDANGGITGLRGTALDITARKRSEGALRLQSEFTHSIFNSTDAQLVVVGADGRILQVNDAWRRFAEESQAGEESTWGPGATYFRGCPPEAGDTQSAHEAMNGLRQVQDGSLPYFEIEYPCHSRDQQRWFTMRVLPLRGSPGKVLISHADVTARKLAQEEKEKLEAQLNRAQKLESIGCLAGGIAHEFNNLLMVINGHSGLLLDGLCAPDPLRQHPEAISKAGERAANLTKQLLGFARKQMVHPTVVALHEAVRTPVSMLQHLIGENIKLETHLGRSSAKVMMDQDQVHQVVINLILNSRDAMPHGGRIIISVTDTELDQEGAASVNTDAVAGRYVVLTVNDTGHGFDDTIRQKIFEPFFSTKEVGKGTGLGLSTVYGIVRQNGGWIDVRSQVGVGTSFRIYLPRVDECPLPAEDATSVARKFGRKTILVVEDEDAIRSLTMDVLRNYGYEVLEAPDGEAAIALAECYPGPIDLLLTDVVLPGLDGKSVAERLRAVRPSLKAIFTSGHTAEVISQHGVGGREVVFLSKPFKHNELVVQVREVLAESAPPQEFQVRGALAHGELVTS